MPVRSYGPDTDSVHVFTVTLNLEIWHWLQIMTHPVVMVNICGKYTRQNKLRVTPRSKQCNSIFSKLPGLISISDCYNNLTEDILDSDEQFRVKIFFSKNLIFEISKTFIFNQKSLNFHFLWLINHFPIRLVKRALINRFFTTISTISDSHRFFQYEISSLFSTLFQKVDGRRRRHATVISNFRVY